jgi:hypothetical protein
MIMKIWERSIIAEEDCIFCWIFFWFWSLGGLLQGCTRLLGVLGSGAVEGKSPCGQVDLLLRARLLTLKTEDAYHGH